MTIPPTQTESASFLTGLAGKKPRETHISAVFIGTDTVWKMKKAVALPFLDFTGLDARHHFLRRELELNKPAAPHIYRDVVPVCRTADGSLALGGGQPVEWVLRMARVADDDFLTAIVARGPVSPGLADALGDCVFDYHTRLPAVPNWDSVASMHRIAEGNARAAMTAGLPGNRVRSWHDSVLTEVSTQAEVLRRRAASGFVRRCHGDLHLGNLCLWDDKPVAFDALEFDEGLATIDVAYDLAFLLMDLDLQAGRQAANRVMNRYLGRTGDTGGLAILQMFLSQRAFIRAHVLKSLGDGDGALHNLNAAEAYLRPSPHQVIAIGGLQGSGKTTIARDLAPSLGPAPGAVIVRSDEVRKRLFDRLPEDRLPPDAYSEAANAKTNAAVVTAALEAARGGHSVIVDSTFLDLKMRTDLAATCRSARVPFTGFWLTAPLSVLEERIRHRHNDASDATVAILYKAAARGIDAGTWQAVDATNRENACQAIVTTLGLTPL
jgi:uncharacterized protein